MDVKDPDIISDLLFRYVRGELNDSEMVRLQKWRLDSERHEALFQRVTAEHYLEVNRTKCLLSEKEQRKEWEKIKKSTISKSRIYRVWQYAAIFLLPLVIGLVYLERDRLVASGHPVGQVPDRATSVAVLTLDDGTTINLEELSTDSVNINSQSRVIKSGDTLRYDILGTEKQEIQYNTLTIPKGAEYHLMLSDGTVVYLNSASSLRYPVAFKGDQRKVELRGEGYFEVKRDVNKPFIVKAVDVEIKVLGTSFGIRAYEDENQVLTTLVEGSVNVRKNQSEVLLRPSQQAVCMAGVDNIAVQVVNVEHFVGWKSGRFVFDNLRLEDIINRIQKWYDFEVFYQNDELKNLPFSVNIVKYEDFARFFKALERTESVRFEIKGKSVIVKR